MVITPIYKKTRLEVFKNPKNDRTIEKNWRLIKNSEL